MGAARLLPITAALLLCCSDQGSNNDAGRETGAADRGAAEATVKPDLPIPDRGGTTPDQPTVETITTRPDRGAPDRGGGTPDLTAPDTAPAADLAMAGDALLARCKPMDARGEGACDMHIGIKWDGKQCVNVSGCRCVGTDCSRLFKTKAACQAAYVGCP